MALFLAKHSMPQINPAVPAPQWMLSEEGRMRSLWLGEQMKRHGVKRVFSSDEPKAVETADIAATVINATAAPRVDLQENDRTGLGFLEQAALRQRIRDFFDKPSELIMGKETAQAALSRFSAAIDHALTEARGANVAIVAHGTVITLFVAKHNVIPQYPFWEHLGLPSYVLLETDKFKFDGKIHNWAG